MVYILCISMYNGLYVMYQYVQWSESGEVYSYLKEKALDRIKWRNRFGRGFGPVVWQITDDDDVQWSIYYNYIVMYNGVHIIWLLLMNAAEKQVIFHAHVDAHPSH
jgi:hypothetical protein